MKNNYLKSLLFIGGLSLAASTSVFASEAEEMFKRMDLNGDKKVTPSEHAQFAETSFMQGDVDRNGKLTAAECEAAQAVHGQKIDQKATAAHLRAVDTDGDGQISNAENAAYAKSAFVRADKNSDGSLNEDEVEDAHKAMKKEMKN